MPHTANQERKLTSGMILKSWMFSIGAQRINMSGESSLRHPLIAWTYRSNLLVFRLAKVDNVHTSRRTINTCIPGVTRSSSDRDKVGGRHIFR